MAMSLLTVSGRICAGRAEESERHAGEGLLRFGVPIVKAGFPIPYRPTDAGRLQSLPIQTIIVGPGGLAGFHESAEFAKMNGTPKFFGPDSRFTNLGAEGFRAGRIFADGLGVVTSDERQNLWA